MRKLIFFVVLLCMVGYSQVIQYRDTSYTGNQQFKTVMPTQPLPVKDSLGNANLDELPYIYDALSSGVPVTYDTVAAGDSVVSTSAYGTWEFEWDMNAGADEIRFIYDKNTNGYCLYWSEGDVIIADLWTGVINSTVLSGGSGGIMPSLRDVKITRTINGTFYLYIDDVYLGSATNNTYQYSGAFYMSGTTDLVYNLTITPLTLFDVTKDLSQQNKLLRDSLATVNNELRLQKTLLTGLYPNATGSSSTTYSKVDTATTTSDSVSTSFTSNYFDILNNGSVPIYFCTDVTFGSNRIVVPAYASYRWSVRATRIHYKTLTSTAEVYIIAQ